MYFIKRVHFLIETFLDFLLNNSRLRVVLMEVFFGEFEKQANLLKMIIKICKNYLSQNSLFFNLKATIFFKLQFYKNKYFSERITRTPSRF